MYPHPEELLGLLAVGSISAAGLTLAGGNFLKECIKLYVEKSILYSRYDDFPPLNKLFLPFTNLILITVLLFLFSGLFALSYILLNNDLVIYFSYFAFCTAVILLIINISMYLIEPIILYIIFEKNQRYWKRP